MDQDRVEKIRNTITKQGDDIQKLLFGVYEALSRHHVAIQSKAHHEASAENDRARYEARARGDEEAARELIVKFFAQWFVDFEGDYIQLHRTGVEPELIIIRINDGCFELLMEGQVLAAELADPECFSKLSAHLAKFGITVDFG